MKVICVGYWSCICSFIVEQSHLTKTSSCPYELLIEHKHDKQSK